MNIFLCNFIPDVCPCCGERLAKLGGMSRSDFHNHASFSCACGARYQYVEEKELLDAAEKVGGDIKNWQR